MPQFYNHKIWTKVSTRLALTFVPFLEHALTATRSEPKLMYVLKLLLWSERQMDKKKIKYPKINIESLLHGSNVVSSQQQFAQTIDHLMAQIQRDEELMDLSQDK